MWSVLEKEAVAECLFRMAGSCLSVMNVKAIKICFRIIAASQTNVNHVVKR